MMDTVCCSCQCCVYYIGWIADDHYVEMHTLVLRYRMAVDPKTRTQPKLNQICTLIKRDLPRLLTSSFIVHGGPSILLTALRASTKHLGHTSYSPCPFSNNQIACVNLFYHDLNYESLALIPVSAF